MVGWLGLQAERDKKTASDIIAAKMRIAFIGNHSFISLIKSSEGRG